MSDQLPQTIQLRGQLTSADMRKTEPIHIDVPEGVTNIHVRFSHHPKAPPTSGCPTRSA